MKTNRIALLPIIGALLLSIFLIFALFKLVSPSSSIKAEQTLKLVSDEKERLSLVGANGRSSYTIIYSSDEDSCDSELASELQLVFIGKSVTGVLMKSDTLQSYPQKYEILLGNTNRTESKELLTLVEGAMESADDYAWGFAVIGQKLVYIATSPEAFVYGAPDFIALLSEGDLTVDSDLLEIKTVPYSVIEAEMAEKRALEIERYKNLVSEFDLSAFGSMASTSMSGAKYGTPTLYPTDSSHPRVNIAPYTLSLIKEYMALDEAAYTVSRILEMADTDYDGVLPAPTEHTTGRTGTHNMDEEGLGIIEAKAFMYLLTGDDLYGYQAIYALKNYLLTLDVVKIPNDQCRMFGHVMFCAAEVYDWCYSIMTDGDREQIIMAVAVMCSSSNRSGVHMEVGFPPQLQSVVSGHSSEHQVLRDYLSFAIAIFDEDPTWYEWIGGLVYNYYIPFRDFYFKSGTYPQGLNCYAPFRFDADLWSAWLLMSATGENPYSDDLARVARSFFEMEKPDGSFFSTGDGRWLTNPNTFSFWHHATVSSALYGDEMLRAQMMSITRNLTEYTATTVDFSYVQMLFLSASYHSKVENTDNTDRFYGMSTVCYFGSPLGQMTVREQWGDSASAAVFMKIGERSTANHEHADAGTFQIYYKGLYTGDSGSYDSYASTHWTYYHTQTVAHNGLLISDLSRIGTSSSNAASYYYSGGQRKLTEATDLDNWLTSYYDTGKIHGAHWSYNVDGSTDYAYLGGEITAAYDSSTVSYVSRRMLTYYTSDPDVPMYFVTYDKITSTGADFKKSFVLHATNKPTLAEDGVGASFEEGNGKLVLMSLSENTAIEAIGGAGMTFAINGRQCAPTSGMDGKEWGRVEISPTTNALTHTLLNFIYVTDKGTDPAVAPMAFYADNLEGVRIDRLALVFAESDDGANVSELNFTLEGKGLCRYIVTGMYPGLWNVTVDGVSVAHSVSGEGVLEFYAPFGEVTVSPSSDITPQNGGRIIYNAFGGIVPDDAPVVYTIGVPVVLPTDIKNGNSMFVGWYTSPTYEPETLVTELVATEVGRVNLYARYKGVAVSEDYESVTIGAEKASANGIIYTGKSHSYFKTVYDEATDNTYMHITRGDSDPQIDIMTLPQSYLYGDTKLTLVLDLAKDDSTTIVSECRLRGPNGAADTVYYFTIINDGVVMLGGSIPIMELNKQFQTLAVTVDFAAGTISAYDSVGVLLGTVEFTPPKASGLTSTLDWMKTLAYSVNWRLCAAGDTMLMDNVMLYAGEYQPKPIEYPDGFSPETMGTVHYVLSGGELAPDAPAFYVKGERTALTSPTKPGTYFLGWYTDSEYSERIYEITPDEARDLVLYACWSHVIADYNAANSNVNLTGSGGGVESVKDSGFEFQTKGENSYLQTVTDPNGDKYLLWHKGSSDPQIFKSGNLASSAYGIKQISFTFTMSRDSSDESFGLTGRMRTGYMGNGKSYEVTLFEMTSDGTVYLSWTDTYIAANLTSSFTTFGIVADFETGMLYAYDSAGKKVAETEMYLPPYFSSYSDLYSALTRDILGLYAYGNAESALLIKQLKVESGNIFEVQG